MENLAKLDQEFVWHPFTQMKDWLREEPIVRVDDSVGGVSVESLSARAGAAAGLGLVLTLYPGSIPP